MPVESDRRQVLQGLARRALQHYRKRSTDQAESTRFLPIGTYLDPERYRAEIDRIFRHLPLALALSVDLPDSGSYLSLEVLGVPVLVIRGQDGRARAFLNSCRHRGAPLCAPGRGRTSLLTCPYHAWSYNQQGSLVRIAAEPTFGEVAKDRLSLVALDCHERAGLIWVALTPGEAHDIDGWLGGFKAELESLRLGEWHIFEQRELAGPGWKVTMDGYLEAYHHDAVHGRTVGKYTLGNLLVLDTFGPHQRLTFARRSLSELESQPQEEWQPEQHIRLIHSGFPNLSISGVVGGHCLVSQVFPGPGPETTTTRQTILCATKPESDAEQAAARLFSDMVLQAVRDEDYAIGLGIQRAIRTGAMDGFTLGRNEPAVQNYHRWVEHFMQLDVRP